MRFRSRPHGEDGAGANIVIDEVVVPRMRIYRHAVGEIERNIQDVLHHTRFLVISFFNEKGVVLDSFGKWLGGDRCSHEHRACYNQKTSDLNKGAPFRFCDNSCELQMFHGGRSSPSNLSAGIAQSREISKEHLNPVTAVFATS